MAAQALAALALLTWGTLAWWRELENLAAKVGNSVAYLAVLPFWYADALLPVPETVALPALPSGQTFEMGCKPGRDDLQGKCPDAEQLARWPLGAARRRRDATYCGPTQQPYPAPTQPPCARLPVRTISLGKLHLHRS